MTLLLPGNGTGQSPDSVFEEYDYDGDGVIDRIEFGMSAVAQKAREAGREDIIGSRFDKLDTNRDNAVSREEFHAALKEQSGEVKMAAFEENDRNDDRKLDSNEFLQAAADFEKAEAVELEFRATDTDRDGFVDVKEWKNAVRASHRDEEQPNGRMNFITEAFEKADRDRNGKLNQTEFSRTPLADRIKLRGGRDMVEVFFARLDTNRDAEIDLEEFSAAAPKGVGMGKGKGKGKGGPKGRGR